VDVTHQLLVNNLGSTAYDRRRQGQANLLRGLEIEDKLVSLDRFDRQLAGFGALEDLVNVCRSGTSRFRKGPSKAYQCARVSVLPRRECCNPVLDGSR
jgi:hypothetical protein